MFGEYFEVTLLCAESNSLYRERRGISLVCFTCTTLGKQIIMLPDPYQHNSAFTLINVEICSR